MRKKLADQGWLALSWPKEYGGGGATHMQQAIFTDEWSYAYAPGRDGEGIGYIGPAIMVHGTEEQKKQHLSGIARGEVVWCQGYSEPESGSDLASLGTRAVLEGDEWVINGQKIWTSQAHYSDWILLLARTDPNAPKHRGITMFLADMKTSGRISPTHHRHVGRASLQRDLLRQRTYSQGERGRRDQPGLVRRDDPAGL